MSQLSVPALPTTAQGIYDEAARVRALRRRGLTWAEASAETGYTRVECIRLAHGESQLMTAIAVRHYNDINYRIPPD